MISFTSDFGLADPYVGTVKAVILGICPEAQIVDLTHAVAPQAVTEAVFLTQQAWPYFPEGSIHLVVVDPGVGTDRRPLAIRGPRGFAVGPDNGVLSGFLPDRVREEAETVGERPSTATSWAPAAVRLPPEYEARCIGDHAAGRESSATFQGRDVFGPAAAQIAGGRLFSELGPLCDAALLAPPLRARVHAGVIDGEVLHIDRFGNLLTSIRAADLPALTLGVEIMERRVRLVRTYADQADLCCLVGSGGFLEVALPMGSAAAALAAPLGTRVRVISP